MEEYIRLEEEKARKHEKVFNWETAKYDFFKDFEDEYPAIVYNDALTSKSNFSTEPTLCPQHIDEFDLKEEISLSECDKEEQNILYFSDLFPFNIIYPDDSKSDKDSDDDDKIDIEHSSGDLSVKPLPDARILELKRRYFEDYYSDDQYAVSIKEDMVYPCLNLTKDHEGNKINTPYPEEGYTPYRRYSM
uniref:Uncharacterized protein n=1 Tax=Tanacetum cinerariifolium TaxID=118510 RepID=A0A6L2NLQ2_TANCI|nr:hypothetical protein [Tanacetum cinerariifolium]